MNFLSPIIFLLYASWINVWSNGLPKGADFEEFMNSIKTGNSKKRLEIKEFNRIIEFSHEIYERIRTHEEVLEDSAIEIDASSPSHGQFIDSFPEPEAMEMMTDALIAMSASAQIGYQFCSTAAEDLEQCGSAMKYLKLWRTPMAKSCHILGKICEQKEIDSKYRSIDGSCNNEAKGGQGSSFTVYQRLLFPNFMDGIRLPRRSVTKAEMPSANLISSELYLNPKLTKNSLAFLYWGQFIQHDLSHTATRNMVHTKKHIECCSPDGWTHIPRKQHNFCFPIDVPPSNAYYSSKDIACISYVQSMPAIGPDCSLGPIQQNNQATHFLDGSQIYGSNARQHKVIRNFSNGHLKTSSDANSDSDLLPLLKDFDQCPTPLEEKICFQSGDKRVNSNPYITTIYTLWVREHNRIATELKNLNPTWNSETVFQEARRIVIAEMQHITYEEWIPSLLGAEIVGCYNPTEDPSVTNAFATAAMPALNSVGSGKLSYSDEEEKYHGKSPRDVDALVKEITTEHFRGGRLEYIREHEKIIYGYDILSIDIQRGRDHGLPTYNEYRKLCGLESLSEFSDLKGIVLSKTLESLQQNYQSVKDIDLIVGGLAEIPKIGIFGPTLSCLLNKQFTATKRGDRYFYSNEDQPFPFSESQLEEIRKVTLARIICDNTDTIEKIQPNVFELGNQSISCSKIPKLNLRMWASKR